jgi:general secretion pathway protein D
LKHLNPLRTLRLLIAVSAIAAPVSMPSGLIVPAGIVATISCAASYAVAQSPTLPPLPPPAQPIPAVAGSTAAPADAIAAAKSLLIKARAAMSDGKSEIAAQAFAQAALVAQPIPEMANELQQTKQQFMTRGMSQQTIDQAILVAQSNAGLNSRAANALRSKTAGNLPLRTEASETNSVGSNVQLPSNAQLPSNMLPPGLLTANTNGLSQPTNMPSTLPPAMMPPATNRESTLPPALARSNMQSAGPENPLRDQAVGLAVQAKMALDRGDVASAKQFIERANSLRVPDSEYAPGQVKPWNVALDIDRAERLRSNSGVSTATAVIPAAGATGNLPQTAFADPASQGQSNVQPGIYQPGNDQSRVAPASGTLASYDKEETAQELYQQGIAALSAGNKEAAIGHFKSAWQKQADLDPGMRAQLKDKLTLLQSSGRSSGEPEGIEAVSPEARENQMKRQKWFAEVTGEIADAERMAAANKPMEALDRLKTLRQRVSQSDLDGAQRKNLLAMVDRVTTHMQAWVDENKSTIELDQRNKQIEDRIQQDAVNQGKTDAQVQTLVDQYNDLIDSARYPEAEEVAKKVAEIKPKSEIASILYNKAKIQRRVEEADMIRAMKEEGFIDVMVGVDQVAIPFDDRNPYQMPSLRGWSELTKRRLAPEESGMSPAEKKIRETLGEQFSASFDKRPLADAMNTISEMTGIPIIIDDRSIAEEGITVDQPISLDLKGNSITLKSAMNNILERLNLTYSVKNEVLTIESARFSKKKLEVKPYNVKDLVIPIPNFVSDYNTGLAGALQSAYQAQTHMASATVQEDSVSSRMASVNPSSSILAQMNTQGSPYGMSPGAIGGSFPGAMQGSSTGLGGAAMANYFELRNLIETTISPDQWQAAGGNSSMQEFRQNLSLVVTAPQETHEAIADLLKSLRSLQNLQVTIEVRFIQLEDTFFERIGVDFDFNINDKVRQLPRENGGQSVAVGLTSATGSAGPQFTGDLDIQLRNTYNVVPAAGRPDAGSGTSIGLAILSDLELFFFLEAAQGNSRSNVLQAPKVTMFDGQQASINDFASRPFVISYEPVVGDFAVAQRPIVVVLNEGTQMNVQSVVSQDKRFVRLTLVPQFTRIEAGDRQFTFQGRRTSSTGTSILNNGVPTAVRNNEESLVEGTTVQQPTLGQTSVNTTVSVPDGGTILLGGIKRLREARTERGTPILSKIPYLNRLFKNNAIGRETNTLMMTVTPRIIIPEEEEELLGVSPNRP